MDRDGLIAIAHRAMDNAYAPYSGFRVGAALRFADGTVVSAGNVENASYGLSLCAESVALAKAMDDGHRGGLEAVAVHGSGDAPSPPCGRCRQMLAEMAQQYRAATAGGFEGGDVIEARLSELLPHAFGPANLE